MPPSKIPKGRIIATDIDRRAIEAAKINARTAEVDHLIEFKVCDFRDTDNPYGDGVVVMNLPYGERLGNDDDLIALYKTMGDFFKRDCFGKWGYIFTGNFDLAKMLLNGRLFLLFYLLLNFDGPV